MSYIGFTHASLTLVALVALTRQYVMRVRDETPLIDGVRKLLDKSAGDA